MSDERPAPPDELVHLLSELVLTLYGSAPHQAARRTLASPLTGRQMEAVVLLSQRGRLTMGELADGLGIGLAAASELAGRLREKGLIWRRRDDDDGRVVRVGLAEPAQQRAGAVVDHWRVHLEAACVAHPGITPEELAAFLRTLIDSLKGEQTS